MITVEGVKERAKFEQSSNSQSKPESSMHLPQTTRRRRGPSFLPSEHDELPPGIAFMVAILLSGMSSLLTIVQLRRLLQAMLHPLRRLISQNHMGLSLLPHKKTLSLVSGTYSLEPSSVDYGVILNL